jgi:hypothetical protein
VCYPAQTGSTPCVSLNVLETVGAFALEAPQREMEKRKQDVADATPLATRLARRTRPPFGPNNPQ